MPPTATDKKSKRRQRIRIFLWALLVVSLAVGTLSLTRQAALFVIIYGVGLLIGVGILVSLAVTSKKYYNYGIFFSFSYVLLFLAPLMSTYLFDFQNSTFQTIFRLVVIFLPVIFTAVILYFVVFSIRFGFLFRSNRFIQSFGVLTGVLVIMAFINFQFGGGNFSAHYNYVTLLLLIILSLALIFMLPGIDFASWRPHERKVLYRMIIAPLAMLLVLNIFLNFSPELLRYDLYGSNLFNPWGLQEVELLELEGISPSTQ